MILPSFSLLNEALGCAVALLLIAGFFGLIGLLVVLDQPTNHQ